jgi:hypothetical protein
MTTTKAKQARLTASAARPKQEIPRVGLKAVAEVSVSGLFAVRLLLGEDRHRYVLPAEIAERLGAAVNAAKARAKRAYRGGCRMMRYPSPSGEQDGLALDLKYLPAFLLGFDRTRVRDEVRARLDGIQEEMYEALAAYTFEGAAVNPHFATPLPPPVSSRIAELEARAAQVEADAAELAKYRRWTRFIAGLRARVLQVNDQIQDEHAASRAQVVGPVVGWERHLVATTLIVEDCILFLEQEMQGLDGLAAVNDLDAELLRRRAARRGYFHWVRRAGDGAEPAAAPKEG